MPSKLPKMTIRIKKLYIKKLSYIAYRNGRSQNSQVRQILVKYIERYEELYGEIKVDE
jgi:predicted DNA-binding protein